MKFLTIALSALAFLGAASVASAEPTYHQSERTFWENQQMYGN